MAELLSNLESNDPKLVEESKLKFHEQFNAIKEPWLVNGLYETYLTSNSTRLMEVLVNVKEPHYTYLFDKISESIKCSKDNMKLQGLSLLGHIVRNQPAWMYKITNHSLMKDLLKLLKTETDILTLLSALMALIVLLPSIPSFMAGYLQDVFDIFCRLAGWNCHKTGKMQEEQMTHMQVTLYALFLRLYAMYPCNFLAYLRDQYRNKNLGPVFCHTIKPMLDAVKMHPHLVTTSKANETSTDRWKKMGAHDIIVECERFSLDLPEKCSHEQCFISTCRPKSTTSILNTETSNQLQTLKTISASSAVGNEGDFFSPSMLLHCATPPVNDKSLPTPIPFAQGNVQTTLISSVTQISQESSSPPEAAIEATPETTPVRDNRMNVRVPPTNSTIARAHTFATRAKPLASGHNTPINSQPSSPLRKEASPFNFQDVPRHFASYANTKRESGNRLQKMLQDRSQMGGDSNMRSPFMMVCTSPSKGLTQEMVVPCSPTQMQRLDSPLSQEDEEVSQIVRQGETIQYPGIRQCDSVLHEVEGFRGVEDDVDNCEQEHGSPCTEGGLHMPNSKSINDLTMRMRRLRYDSQCADEEKYERSTGSSPGNAISYPNNISVRRANSCPEMKKSPIVSGKDSMNDRTLLETDEDGGIDVQDGKQQHITNGIDASSGGGNRKKRERKTIETQTENLWPLPYDHLFPSIFPSLETNGSVTLIGEQDNSQSANAYEISDKYIDISAYSNEKDLVNHLKCQIELLQLQLHFEKHRREMHAMKNRRLLADARNIRALEEHKDALMDTVRIEQNDIDSLKAELELLKREKHCKEKEALDNAKFWDQQYKILQNECKKLKEHNVDYQKEIDNLRNHNAKLETQWQDSEANLLNAIAEVKIAKEQADAGEKGRIELEHLNKELLLVGELQLKYQERLNDLVLSKRGDIEQKRLFDVHKHEMQVLNQQLETKKKNLEACGTRISELDSIVQKHDEFCALQKRQLNDVKEEYHEKLKAVESKYQTQLIINRSQEEEILKLRQRIDILSKKVISPDISSCHEVNATLTSTTQGLSSHSSPLSASLASSEGSMASTISEVQNLQVM